MPRHHRRRGPATRSGLQSGASGDGAVADMTTSGTTRRLLLVPWVGQHVMAEFYHKPGRQSAATSPWPQARSAVGRQL